jgi:hypothetical protein
MQIHGKVGPIVSSTSLSDGTSNIDMRMGRMGEQIVSELHGRYYEAAYRRSVFSGGNAVGVVTSVGVTATYTGLCLTNPLANTVNLVLLKCGYAFSVVQPTAALVIGLMTTYHASTAVTQTTPITPVNNYIGIGSAPTGLLASSVACATAFTLRAILGSLGTAALTVPVTQPPAFFDLEGSIILPPGACVAFFTNVISGAAGFWGSFMWEEVPV